MRSALLFFLCLWLYLCSGVELFAQSRFLVSQYMYNGLVLNPAYAGSQQQFSLAALYRNQWLNIEGSPTFEMISVHTPVFSNRIGVGMLLSAEQIGVHKEYGVFSMFAYKLKLYFGYLTFGLSGGFSAKNSDYTQLRRSNDEDPYLQVRANSTAPNFGVGTYFYSGRMYAGLSVPYLLNTERLDVPAARNRSVLRDIRSYYLTAGFLLGESRFFKFNPSFLLRVREGSPLSADLNANLIFKKRVLLGGSFRAGSGSGLVLLSQLILNDNFRVMYSYDFTTSDLSERASGTHEIMLNYRIIIRALVRDPHCSAYF